MYPRRVGQQGSLDSGYTACDERMNQSAKQETRKDGGGGSDADVLVTGSSGFIGTHLCRVMLDSQPGLRLTGLDLVAPGGSVKPPGFVQADISELGTTAPPDQLRHPVVMHLAAKAEVVFPFEGLSDLVATNISGTLRVLQVARPELVVFASSSAVYGDTGVAGVSTRWENVTPIGSYGMSKAAAELMCGEWARETNNTVVSLRFGNVVGAGCRGFVPYLVAHARRYPDGAVPAKARGNGRIIRDYVPVGYVVEIVRKAMAVQREPGGALALNVGTGRPMTNGEVAAIVQEALEEKDIRLKIDWGSPLVAGEAQSVVLDMEQTARVLSVGVPTHEQVIEAIRASVDHWLSVSACGREGVERGS